MVEKYNFKYKFLLGEPIKSGVFEGTTITSQTCDANFIKGNDKWISYIPQGTGGGVLVNLKRDNPCRIVPDYP